MTRFLISLASVPKKITHVQFRSDGDRERKEGEGLWAVNQRLYFSFKEADTIMVSEGASLALMQRQLLQTYASAGVGDEEDLEVTTLGQLFDPQEVAEEIADSLLSSLKPGEGAGSRVAALKEAIRLVEKGQVA